MNECEWTWCVACVRCGATEGRQCVSLTGTGRRVASHNERLRKAWKMRRAFASWDGVDVIARMDLEDALHPLILARMHLDGPDDPRIPWLLESMRSEVHP